jgi:hypothetical protein
VVGDFDRVEIVPAIIDQIPGAGRDNDSVGWMRVELTTLLCRVLRARDGWVLRDDRMPFGLYGEL